MVWGAPLWVSIGMGCSWDLEVLTGPWGAPGGLKEVPGAMGRFWGNMESL